MDYMNVNEMSFSFQSGDLGLNKVTLLSLQPKLPSNRHF